MSITDAFPSVISNKNKPRYNWEPSALHGLPGWDKTHGKSRNHHGLSPAIYKHDGQRNMGPTLSNFHYSNSKWRSPTAAVVFIFIYLFIYFYLLVSWLCFLPTPIKPTKISLSTNNIYIFKYNDWFCSKIKRIAALFFPLWADMRSKDLVGELLGPEGDVISDSL